MHIVIDKSGIVAADGSRGVIQDGQQILLDIPDFGGVLFHAIQRKLDMLCVQLQEPGTDNLMREIAACDAGIPPGSCNHLNHKFHDFIQ